MSNSSECHENCHCKNVTCFVSLIPEVIEIVLEKINHELMGYGSMGCRY